MLIYDLKFDVFGSKTWSICWSKESPSPRNYHRNIVILILNHNETCLVFMTLKSTAVILEKSQNECRQLPLRYLMCVLVHYLHIIKIEFFAKIFWDVSEASSESCLIYTIQPEIIWRCSIMMVRNNIRHIHERKLRFQHSYSAIEFLPMPKVLNSSFLCTLFP